MGTDWIQFQSDKGLGKVALGGFFLGSVFTAHLILLGYYLWTFPTTPFFVFRWTYFMLALTTFHFSEFVLTAIFKPFQVSYESFLLNHSTAYTVAILVGWTEFWLEVYWIPEWKEFNPYFYGALAVLFIGQAFRAIAMWAAGSNFSHRIEFMKRKEHELVTTGIYRYIRHPSYFGWFYFAIGTQLLLANPICSVVYTIASWMFFKGRIPYEEELLEEFFPQQYAAYKKRTISGIPFV